MSYASHFTARRLTQDLEDRRREGSQRDIADMDAPSTRIDSTRKRKRRQTKLRKLKGNTESVDSAQQPFGFLDLPLEIRGMVYSMLSNEEYIIFGTVHHPEIPDTDINSNPSFFCMQMSFLRTCRQISEEVGPFIAPKRLLVSSNGNISKVAHIPGRLSRSVKVVVMKWRDFDSGRTDREDWGHRADRRQIVKWFPQVKRCEFIVDDMQWPMHDESSHITASMSDRASVEKAVRLDYEELISRWDGINQELFGKDFDWSRPDRPTVLVKGRLYLSTLKLRWPTTNVPSKSSGSTTDEIEYQYLIVVCKTQVLLFHKFLTLLTDDADHNDLGLYNRLGKAEGYRCAMCPGFVL